MLFPLCCGLRIRASGWQRLLRGHMLFMWVVHTNVHMHTTTKLLLQLLGGCCSCWLLAINCTGEQWNAVLAWGQLEARTWS